ncbi:3'(2'),5'-bisphosphate nucleotidase CysQ [Rhodobacteraceae bacterium 2CG4]|uniref:3'(2'),5'-bisphosphate nucleotidase CysQ n=1 Tax=Halovulum marinum TaxID=2662447 RepID=A0A6L5Z664_9RHOB|nr:3'(2'),5'-bisphosphate nucleotidase CysQ [Halovulum marinum]MSU91937.1 3'(2'),5'-bisphosphate nucleotidase CysQ [Halovulum marinum]
MPGADAAATADDLALLVRAARIAGPIAMRHFRAAPRAWDKPGGAGPVSEADLEVDAALAAVLRAARPDYGWLSEESPDDAARLQRARVFVVDPIDGTRAFLAGTSAFSHALAVVERGAVTAAVVYLPAQDRLFAAARGGGASLNGAAIRVSAAAEPAASRILATRPSLLPEHWPRGVPTAERGYRPSLAYRMCLVAEGRYDALATFRDSWDWDLAAGTLIVREAGGTVTDAAGAAPVFATARPRQAGCIAAPPALHRRLLALRGVA